MNAEPLPPISPLLHLAVIDLMESIRDDVRMCEAHVLALLRYQETAAARKALLMGLHCRGLIEDETIATAMDMFRLAGA